MEIDKIYQGDCLEVLKTFEDNSIDCCVTSPPYYANAVIFDNNHIFRTVWIMSDGYELNICTIPYTDSSHSIFKEKFIEPLLDDDGFIKEEYFGKRILAKFPVFDVNYVILNEFNKK